MDARDASHSFTLRRMIIASLVCLNYFKLLSVINTHFYSDIQNSMKYILRNNVTFFIFCTSWKVPLGNAWENPTFRWRWRSNETGADPVP